MAAPYSPEELALIHARVPRVIRGEVSVYRVARDLTNRGAPLQHRSFQSVKRYLRRILHKFGGTLGKSSGEELTRLWLSSGLAVPASPASSAGAAATPS